MTICALFAWMSILLGQAKVQYSLNENWMFSRSDSLGNYAQWQRVDIPHTWNAEDTDDEIPGYFRGKCKYVKRFMVPQSMMGQRVMVYFEGANQETTLWLNGKQIGRHIGGYTGFCFDLTSVVKFGQENLMEVEVSNAYNSTIAPLSADFTFYGGIYRDVWLSYLPQVHFSTSFYGSTGMTVTTPRKNGKFEGVEALCRIKNDTQKRQDLMLRSSLLDAAGNIVKTVTQRIKLPVGKNDYIYKVMIPMTRPHLWSDKDPYLYSLRSEIVNADTHETIDEVFNAVGFRWFSFDSNKGFFLNGKHLKLIGTSRHQDFLKKGNALSDNIHVSDVYKLKEMGGNFLRVAHYPQDPTILETCDRLGILTSVEIPVVNAVDGSQAFLDNCKRMEMEMICQNRNHPSVVMWGWMNEILLRIPSQYENTRSLYYPMTRKVALALDSLARQEDPERYTMMAIHNAFERYKEAGLVDIPQVLTLNLYQGWYEKNINEFEQTLDKIHKELPNKPLMVTEYGAGIDPRLHSSKPERFDFSQEYGVAYHVHYLREMLKRDFVAGSSIWNLNDFYSEVRGDAVPHVNSKGVLGLDRCQKDAYLYYKSMLSSKPILFIGGKNWTYRTGVGDNGNTLVDVPVFTRAPEVMIYVNGQMCGKFATHDGVAWANVPMVDGNNQIKAQSTIGDRDVFDVIDVQMDLVPSKFSNNFPVKGLHVMCGSNRYFEDKEESLCWLPEQSYTQGGWGYIGGSEYRRSGQLLGTDADILGTDKDPIFQTQRQNIEAFVADVPDGEYIITLSLAQLKEAASLVYNLNAGDENQKQSEFSVFDVVVNGHKTLDKFDMSQYGYSRAAIVKMGVVAKKGQGIDIRFVPYQGKTILNAIEIYKR